MYFELFLNIQDITIYEQIKKFTIFRTNILQLINYNLYTYIIHIYLYLLYRSSMYEYFNIHFKKYYFGKVKKPLQPYNYKFRIIHILYDKSIIIK